MEEITELELGLKMGFELGYLTERFLTFPEVVQGTPSMIFRENLIPLKELAQNLGYVVWGGVTYSSDGKWQEFIGNRVPFVAIRNLGFNLN